MSIISHIKESRAEMKHVKWPTKKQVTGYTVAVVGLSICVGAYIAGLDAVFAQGLAWLIANVQPQL